MQWCFNLLTGTSSLRQRAERKRSERDELFDECAVLEAERRALEAKLAKCKNAMPVLEGENKTLEPQNDALMRKWCEQQLRKRALVQQIEIDSDQDEGDVLPLATRIPKRPRAPATGVELRVQDKYAHNFKPIAALGQGVYVSIMKKNVDIRRWQEDVEGWKPMGAKKMRQGATMTAATFEKMLANTLAEGEGDVVVRQDAGGRHICDTKNGTASVGVLLTPVQWGALVSQKQRIASAIA